MKRPFVTLIGYFLAIAGPCAILTLPAPARAAKITLNEVKMDQIFAQAGVDIRFLPSMTYHDTSLLAIDTATEWDFLKNTVYPQASTDKAVGAFFVDSVNWCGGPAPAGSSYTGCGGGWYMMLKSSRQEEAGGYTTMGHELGHNLGLNHTSTDPANAENLMWPYASDTKWLLDTTQITTLLTSIRVQTDGTNKWVNIRPILIAESLPPTPVPEPGTLLLFLSGSAAMGFISRRKAAGA